MSYTTVKERPTTASYWLVPTTTTPTSLPVVSVSVVALGAAVSPLTALSVVVCVVATRDAAMMVVGGASVAALAVGVSIALVDDFSAFHGAVGGPVGGATGATLEKLCVDPPGSVGDTDGPRGVMGEGGCRGVVN